MNSAKRNPLKTLRSLVFATILLAVGLQLISPVITYAIDWSDSSDATIKKAKQLELVYTMTDRCGSKQVSGSTISEFDFHDNVGDGDEGDGAFILENERGDRQSLSTFAASLVGGNDNPTCKTLAVQAAKALSPDGTVKGFMRVFYDYNANDAKWKIKDKYSDPATAYSKLMELADDEELTNDNGGIANPYMYRWYSLRGAGDSGPFTKCFSFVDNGEVSGGIFTLKHDGSGKQSTWKYKSNSAKGDVYKVGMLNDDRLSDYSGNYDGKWSCEEFANAIKAKPESFGILILSQAQLEAYLTGEGEQETQDQKLADLKALLENSANRTIVTDCIANSGDAQLKNMSLANVIPGIAASIINDTESITVGSPTSMQVYTVNALSTAAIKICLNESPIGENIKGIVEREFAPVNLDGATTDDSENLAADDCDGIIPGGVLNKINPAAYLRNSLDWFGCSFSKGMVAIIDKMSDVISDSLATSEDSSQKDAIQGVWNKFLTIANILFVVAFLLMTISTALNLGVFDAYTVKKLLPRILIAALIANLSFPLCYLVINTTNIMGGALYEMISGLIPSNAGSAGVGPGVALAGGIAAGVGAAVVGIATGGIFAVIPALLSALFAIFIAYSIVLIRRIIILLLIVLSPIAAVLWVLPGGEGLAKRWWKTFIQMLLVYPLIMGFIGAGQLASNITMIASSNNGQNDAGFFEGITSLLLLILPLFMLPAVFKMATSTIANITGMVNDRGKGLIDRSKKLRSQKMQEGWEGIKSGNRYKGGKADVDGKPVNFRGRLNKGMQTASLLSKAGFKPSEMRGNIQSSRAAVNFRAAKELMEKNETFKNMSSDDDKLWALQLGGGDINRVKEILSKRAPGRFNAETEPEALNAAAAEVMRVHREGGGQAALIAATMAQAGTGTGYNYGNKGGINDDMYDSIARASGMDKNLAGMMLGEMRPALKNSGRMEFAGGYANTAKVMNKRFDSIRAGAVEGDDNYYGQQQAMLDTTRDAYMSNGGAFIAGKKQTIKMAAPMITQDIVTAAASGAESFTRQIANVAGKYDAAAAVAPQNAEMLQTEVLNKTIDVGSMHADVRAKLDHIINTRDDDGNITGSRDSITVQQAMEGLRSDASFQGTRKEYERSSLNGARAAQEEAMRNNPDGYHPGPPEVPRL